MEWPDNLEFLQEEVVDENCIGSNRHSSHPSQASTTPIFSVCSKVLGLYIKHLPITFWGLNKLWTDDAHLFQAVGIHELTETAKIVGGNYYLTALYGLKFASQFQDSTHPMSS